jgi:hypothetical protein
MWAVTGHAHFEESSMVKHLWWMSAAFVSASVWAQADGANRPVAKVGDVAVYSVELRADKRTTEETVTITSVDQTHIKSKHVRPDRQPPEIEGVRTLDWATVVSGSNGTRYDPPIVSVKFPLAVGDAWKSSFLAEGSTFKSKSDVDYKVVSMEKVKTQAGEFDAFKIESKGWINGVSWSGSVRTEGVSWYAPSLGRFVRSEYRDFRNGRPWNDTVTELKSFTPAP